MCNNHFNNNRTVLTDGGLETTLIFVHDLDLPYFAAFPILRHPLHQTLIDDYYRSYMNIAVENDADFILESATWRASQDWGFKLGYTKEELAEVNYKAIEQLADLREEYKDRIRDIEISGCIGPRMDGYVASEKMTVHEAKWYHLNQIRTLKNAGVDMVTFLTVNYVQEGMGAVLASMEVGIPIVLSFTVETDGKLPGGASLKEAIDEIDQTSRDYPLYYMINCAHPSHFVEALDVEGIWKERIEGLRANASCKSHEELDNSDQLDSGNSQELANWYQIVKHQLPNLRVFGGCCGTSHHHIEDMCRAVR
jgi:S-methylmethionine-dependent homocysteine/selenocysteine methylase